VIHASSGTTSNLTAISCRSALACLAVGDSSAPDPGSPLAWRWDGHRWSNLHPPNHSEFAGLQGVSCSSASSCTAVGHFFVSRDQNAIAERWNGHHWTVRTPPRPAFTGGADLTGFRVSRPRIAPLSVALGRPIQPGGSQKSGPGCSGQSSRRPAATAGHFSKCPAARRSAPPLVSTTDPRSPNATAEPAARQSHPAPDGLRRDPGSRECHVTLRAGFAGAPSV